MRSNVKGGLAPMTLSASQPVTTSTSIPCGAAITRPRVQRRGFAPGRGAANPPLVRSVNGMAYTDVTDATFETDVVERSKSVPVVVDLWAPWCGPCRTLGPIIEKVVDSTNGKVELVKVNVDENPAISQAFRIQSIPAVYALRDGQVVDGFIGAYPEPEVQRFVNTLLPTDEETELSRLIAVGDEESLRRALDLDPDNEDAIVALAELLIAGDGATQALELL